ncbi:MAG TPA: hypothetical protein VFT29_02185 [Gemmatimonadaceae bacterium]|nr:hypothetical protein [Gemmatimonadaceae bacterium]
MILQTQDQEFLIAITGIVSVFVAFPIAIAIARVIWKRASEGPRPKQVDTDSIHRRLDQIQVSVEAMAIEIERISEGQRFVTKLMSERGEREALGSGKEKPSARS